MKPTKDPNHHTARRPNGSCQFDENLQCKICGRYFPGFKARTKTKTKYLVIAFEGNDIAFDSVIQRCDTLKNARAFADSEVGASYVIAKVITVKQGANID